MPDKVNIKDYDFSDIEHKFDPDFYYGTVKKNVGRFLFWIFGKDKPGFTGTEKLKQLNKNAVKIFLSNHNSHVDYLIGLYLLHSIGENPPAIAAGDNLYVNLGGKLNFKKILPKCKCIKIHRSFINKEAKKKSTERLKAYYAKLFLEEDSLFVFPGKGRSYSGESIPFGIAPIRLIIDAGEMANKDLHFIPVQISQEKILEAKILPRLTKYKEKKNILNKLRYYLNDWPHILVTALKHAIGIYPKTYGSFNLGEPISLHKYKKEYGQLDPKIHLPSYIQKKSEDLQEIYSTQLIAYILNTEGKNPLDKKKLLDKTRKYLTELNNRNAKISCLYGKDPNHIFLRASKILGCLKERKGQIFVLNSKLVQYYSNLIQHKFSAKKEVMPNPDY